MAGVQVIYSVFVYIEWTFALVRELELVIFNVCGCRHSILLWFDTAQYSCIHSFIVIIMCLLVVVWHSGVACWSPSMKLTCVGPS